MAELDWMAEGLCREVDWKLFFPTQGGRNEDAKAVCGLCAVRERCLAFALEKYLDFGVWGGMSGRERRELRKARNT